MKGSGGCHPGEIGNPAYGGNLLDLRLFFQGENADKPSPVKIEVIHRPLFDQYTMNPFDFPLQSGRKQRIALEIWGQRGAGEIGAVFCQTRACVAYQPAAFVAKMGILWYIEGK